MICILSKCAWAKDGCCNSLGECGASYALAKSREPGGYLVMSRDNRTIAALQQAGLVVVQTTFTNGHLIVTATSKAFERAA